MDIIAVIMYVIFVGIILIGGIGPAISQYKNSKNDEHEPLTEKELKLYRKQMPIWDDFDEDEYKYTDTY